MDAERSGFHLRGRVAKPALERLGMQLMGRIFASRRRSRGGAKLARSGGGRLPQRLPGPLAGWTMSRDLPGAPQTFREW